ncbi:MAG: adenine phosphoribosyltransferase [bacterium]|nr:adenine phosphoribosyltransferase [bacterium]
MSQDLARYIRDIPDFPKPGIVFKDITTLLQVPEALDEAIQKMSDPFRDKGVEQVVGIESRGFIFGAAMARELNAGFVPIRKPGKLPAETLAMSYELEYGTDQIEIHKDAVQDGQHVLLVDDLLATGGTMEAACGLVSSLGGHIEGVVFLVELAFLDGRKKLEGQEIFSLIQY